MIRTKLAKAILLGACFSLLSTGVAFASADTSKGAGVPGFEGATEENQELYNRQSQIDQFVFKDHVREIEEMGFVVTHTGVMGDVVEVGITPYEDAFAEYLYENLGKEQIQIVEGQLYMPLTAPDSPDAAVSNMVDSEVPAQAEDAIGDVAEEEELKIQITSVDAEKAAESGLAEEEVLEQATSTDVVEDSRVVYATADQDTAEAKENSKVGTIAIAAVAVVAILGVITMVIRKQKTIRR